MAVMKLKTNLLPFLSVVWLAPSKLLAAGHDCVPVVFYVDSAGKRMRYTVQCALTFMESLQQSVFNLKSPLTQWNPPPRFLSAVAVFA